MTTFESQLNYYNAVAGAWEPIVENYKLTVQYEEQYKGSKRKIDIKFDMPININFSEAMLNNLKYTLESIDE